VLLAYKVHTLVDVLNHTGVKGEFEAGMREVGRAMKADEMAQRPALRQLFESGAAYHKAVLRDLNEIRSLATLFDQLDDVIKSYEEVKGWLIRSIDLNHEDADRMMRYQTNLERRLSNAIGELLELQKLRPRKLT
jgi:hypothetical protein